MSLKRSGSAYVLVGAIILAVSLSIAWASSARANPYDINQSNVTATTSVTYIAPGTATSTQTYDSYAGGNSNASSDGVLLVQFVASSTSSVLNIAVQYSMNGIDWYGDDLLTSLNSTTSPVKSINVDNTYTWTAAGTATTSKAILIPTPTRYARAVIGITGAAGAVWSDIVARKEQPE